MINASSKGATLIATRVSVNVMITMGIKIKKPLGSMAMRGWMLRGKRKYMVLLIPRCLAAFPDFMAGGGGFYKCNVSMSSVVTECVVEKRGKIRY